MSEKRNIGETVFLNNESIVTKKDRNFGPEIILQNSAEEQEKILNQSKTVPISALKIVDGRLTVDADAFAQSKGFINASDEANYKAENPDLYEASGGIKIIKPGTNVDITGSPLKSATTYDSNYATNLSSAMVNKAIEDYNGVDIKEIENVVSVLKSGEWQADTVMKETEKKIDTYVNSVIILNELGYLNFTTGTDDERKSTLNSLKSLKYDVKAVKDYFAQYKDETSYNNSVWNSKYSTMTWYDLGVEAARLKNSGETEELEYVNNILNTQDEKLWNDMVELKGKNYDEILNVANKYWNGKNQFETNRTQVVHLISSELSAEYRTFETEEEYIEFFNEAYEYFMAYYKDVGNFDSARKAFQIKKGYLNINGNPDEYKEECSNLIKLALERAQLTVTYGEEEYVQKFYEKEEEYRWNLISSQEFKKYYSEMKKDPNADKYISKGKELYDTKDENISDEEYEVACYYLGRGENKEHSYFVWLKDWVYRREVAAKDGWSALSDGETLKYHTLWSDYTNDAPIEANIKSVLYNLGAGVEFIYNTLNGDVKESKLSKASSKIREAYANSHDGEFLGIDHDMWYNTGMSAIDSVVGNTVGGPYSLAVSAAAAGVNDALDRGMTGSQAFFNGLANGANEYLWEKYSFAQLDVLKESKDAGLMSFFTNMLKSAFTNATEEAITETANILYDSLFNGDLSHYSLSVKRYKDNGYTEEEAKKQTFKDLTNQVVEAAGSGALMGVGFGAHGGVSTQLNATIYGKYYYGFSQNSINALVNNGLAMAEGSEAYQLAVKAETQLKSGKALSGGTLYNLATAIEGEIENKSTARLRVLGMDKKTTKEFAPVVAKTVFGEQLTSQEHEMLKNNNVAIQVVNELSADKTNTIWKDIVKNNNYNSKKENTILHPVSNDNIINTVDDNYDAIINNINETSQPYKINNESNKNETLNAVERTTVLNYKSSESYKINDMLRNSENFSDAESEFVENMDNALIKMPRYQGSVYRNIAFDWFGGKAAYDAFLSKHKVNDFVTYLAYTSASTKEDGYLVDGNFAVSMVIESKNAKNIDGYGNNFESEVIFPRNSVFIVNNVKYNNIGQPIIYMTEVLENDKGKHGQFYSQERSEAVQSLQKSKSRKRNGELQDISDENTIRYFDRKNSLQRVSGKERKLKNLNYNDNSIKEGESYGKEQLRNGGAWRRLAGTNTQSGVGRLQKANGRVFGTGQENIERYQGISFVRDQGNNRGIELSREQVEGLKNAAIKKEDGTPKKVYHFTNNVDFEVFGKGDIGFHFGNELQARQRGENLKQQGRIITAYLDIKNPIYINTDLMSWRPAHVAIKLYADGIITYEQYWHIREMHIESGYEYNSPAAVELRKMLVNLGYDGIVYENHYEGDGRSYVAFYPEQIIIIDDGKNIINEAISENEVAFLNSQEKPGNEIYADEFITGLRGEDGNSATKQNDILLKYSTNAVTNPLSSYAPAKRGMIIGFLESVDERLKSFVERVKNGSNKFERFTVSNVNAREVADIKELLGINIDGYTHNINTNGIKHILRRHGVSGTHDKTMSNDSDIARMGWVINNYDNVEVLFENGKNVTSVEFKDKSNRPAAQIRYSKKINGTYYVVEAVFENDYNKLWVQSAYLKNNKEGVTQDPAEGQKDQPHDYARSSLASPPSNNNISQSAKTVNDGYWNKKTNGKVDSENDFDYNDNSIKEGENYAEDYQGTMGLLGKEIGKDDTDGTSEKTRENARITREMGIAFQRRAKKTYGNAGRLVFHLNTTVAYKVANNIDGNSCAGTAYNILKSKGYNVVYCDGVFEINNGNTTLEVKEAITLFDGTIYISSGAKLDGKGIALHEIIHVWQYNNEKEYVKYEDVLCEEIDRTSVFYEKLAEEINEIIMAENMILKI
ncbi:MAG: hypothetical protein IKT42_02505 [Clostridia bacterium]|nr:hypothetical protein [Clostridia bacterium]